MCSQQREALISASVVPHRGGTAKECRPKKHLAEHFQPPLSVGLCLCDMFSAALLFRRRFLTKAFCFNVLNTFCPFQTNVPLGKNRMSAGEKK